MDHMFPPVIVRIAARFTLIMVAQRDFWHQYARMNRTGNDAGRSPATESRPLVERMPVYALLDNIRSAWNVGSMFRSADAAGLAGMYLTGMTCTPPRPDLEKTALGATESVPWDYFQDPLAAAQAVKNAGRSLVVLEQTSDACDWRHHSFEFPCCFVVGHEVRGVQPGILDLADQIVEIPMAGIKKSLNVAVSFGVLAFAVRNQWLARNNGGTSHG